MQAVNLTSKTNCISLVVRLLALCWLITKLISYKLWLTNRLFPVVPIKDWLVAPGFIHLILFAASLIALLTLCFRPRFKIAAVVLIIAELGSCLLDQNRWQPWEYQFIFMLLPLVFTHDEKRLKMCWQIIIAGLYFFSGLSKLNQQFIMHSYSGMIMQQWMGYTIHDAWMFRLGYLIPLMEMAAAIALFLNRWRKTAVVLLCIMHVLILLMLGPAGLNINMVIWPWNILMPFLLLILFYNNPVSHIILKQKKPLLWLTIFCWWVLPWLNFFGYWDDYFSSKLYSGKTPYLFICTSNPDTKKTFAPYFSASSSTSLCDSSLSVFKWSMQEMNVPPNPQLRVYKKIMQQWQQKYDTALADKFLIRNPAFSKEKWVLLYNEK